MWIIVEGADAAKTLALLEEVATKAKADLLTSAGKSQPSTAFSDNFYGPNFAFKGYEPSSRVILSHRLHWKNVVDGSEDGHRWGDLGIGGWRLIELMIAGKGGVLAFIDSDESDHDEDDFAERAVAYRKLSVMSPTLCLSARINDISDQNTVASLLTNRGRGLERYGAYARAKFKGFAGDPLPTGKARILVATSSDVPHYRRKLLARLDDSVWSKVAFVSPRYKSEITHASSYFELHRIYELSASKDLDIGLPTVETVRDIDELAEKINDYDRLGESSLNYHPMTLPTRT